MKDLREHEMDIKRWNVCYIDGIHKGSKKKKVVQSDIIFYLFIYEFKLIFLYHFFVHLHSYNIQDYSCKKAKDLVVVLLRCQDMSSLNILIFDGRITKMKYVKPP